MAKGSSGKTEKDLIKPVDVDTDIENVPLAELPEENIPVANTPESKTEKVPEVEVPKVSNESSQVVVFIQDVNHVYMAGGYVDAKKNDRRRVSNTLAYYLRLAGYVI